MRFVGVAAQVQHLGKYVDASAQVLLIKQPRLTRVLFLVHREQAPFPAQREFGVATWTLRAHGLGVKS